MMARCAPIAQYIFAAGPQDSSRWIDAPADPRHIVNVSIGGDWIEERLTNEK